MVSFMRCIWCPEREALAGSTPPSSLAMLCSPERIWALGHAQRRAAFAAAVRSAAERASLLSAGGSARGVHAASSREGGALEPAMGRSGRAAASASAHAGPEHSPTASPVTALALGDEPLLPLLAAECCCVQSVTAAQARPSDNLLCCTLDRPHAHPGPLWQPHFGAPVHQPHVKLPWQEVTMACLTGWCVVRNVYRMNVWQCRRSRCLAGARPRPPRPPAWSARWPRPTCQAQLAAARAARPPRCWLPSRTTALASSSCPGRTCCARPMCMSLETLFLRSEAYGARHSAPRSITAQVKKFFMVHTTISIMQCTARRSWQREKAALLAAGALSADHVSVPCRGEHCSAAGCGCWHGSRL